MAEVAGVSLTIRTEDTVVQGLGAIHGRLRGLSRALDEMGSSLVTETQHRFEAQTGPDGKPWAGLAESTLAKKGRSKKGKKPKVLRDQGDLYDSLSHQTDSWIALRVGVTRVYGRIHQLGGMAGRGQKVEIEARPYLGLTDEGRAEIMKVLHDHLKGTA